MNYLNCLCSINRTLTIILFLGRVRELIEGEHLETRWKVTVLTQILMEYFNLTPRFYSRDTLAYALANQFLGYPLRG